MSQTETAPTGKWLLQRVQDKVHNYLMHENFVRFFRFGALDQNILLLVFFNFYFQFFLYFVLKILGTSDWAWY